MDNKDLIMFTACDEKNLPYALKLIKSFQYFHPNIPIRLFTTATKGAPEGVSVTNIADKLARDPMLFYKQKPYFANILFNEGYKAVLGMDSDMIVLGSLDYILKGTNYDIGVVYNFNPLDLKTYGPITLFPLHPATEYLNAGLVMMRSQKFVKHWLKLCSSQFFSRFPYKEQDLLNIMCYFGEYNIFNFDDRNVHEDYAAWHGLLGSSETLNAELRGKDVVIPKNETTGYPSVDVVFKVWHPAGGQANLDKLNYRLKFKDDVIGRINEILKP